MFYFRRFACGSLFSFPVKVTTQEEEMREDGEHVLHNIFFGNDFRNCCNTRRLWTETWQQKQKSLPWEASSQVILFVFLPYISSPWYPFGMNTKMYKFLLFLHSNTMFLCQDSSFLARKMTSYWVHNKRKIWRKETVEKWQKEMDKRLVGQRKKETEMENMNSSQRCLSWRRKEEGRRQSSRQASQDEIGKNLADQIMLMKRKCISNASHVVCIFLTQLFFPEEKRLHIVMTSTIIITSSFNFGEKSRQHKDIWFYEEFLKRKKRNLFCETGCHEANITWLWKEIKSRLEDLHPSSSALMTVTILWEEHFKITVLDLAKARGK